MRFVILGPISTVGMITSFISFWYTNLKIFFNQRIGEERDDDPDWRYKLVLAPVVFFHALSSIIQIYILMTSSYGLGPLIIVCNIFIHYQDPLKHQETLTRELEEKRSDTSSNQHIQNIIDEIPSKLMFSTLTFWMTNTVVVSRKLKFQYSNILLCSPVYFAVILVALIGPNDLPTDTLQKVIFPLACICVLVSIFTGIALYKLSDPLYLVKICGSKAFYYIDVINNPLKYHQGLITMLHNNTKLINRQHPLTGQTILHKLQPKVMEELCKDNGKDPHDEFLKLYIKGRKFDIIDFEARKASSHWINYHMPQLPKSRKSEVAFLHSDLFSLPFLNGRSKWLPYFLLLGYQPSGKDGFGESLLSRLGKELQVANGEEEIQSILSSSCFKYLSPEDIFELMTHTILGTSNNKDRTVRLLSLLAQRHHEQREDHFLMGVLKRCRLQRNEPKMFSTTPLHFAAEIGAENLLERLLELHPFPDIRDDEGKTPLHHAGQGGHDKCIKLLSLANKNEKDIPGTTPSHWPNRNDIESVGQSEVSIFNHPAQAGPGSNIGTL